MSWSEVPLEDLAVGDAPIVYGILKPGPNIPGGIPYVRPTEMGDREIRLGRVLRTTQKIASEFRRSTLRTGDLVLTIVGTIGKIAFVPPELDGGNITQCSVRIRTDPKKANPRYLSWALESPRVRRQYDEYRFGSGVPRLNVGHVRALKIPLPPLPEQRRIADILDKADAIRRKRKEAIALTEQLLRSAFLDMFGDPVTNPKGWEVKPLGDLAEAASGVTKGKKYGSETMVTVPYMRVANVQDGHLVLDEVKTITVSSDDARRYLLKDGDVLLTEGGDPDKLGRGTVWRNEVADCIHQNHIFRVRPTGAVRSEYLSALIGSERGKRYFLRAAKQTTGIATINITQLKSFPVLLPPIDLQDRFLAALADLEASRARQQQADSLIGVLFESLVQRVFGGQQSNSRGTRAPQPGSNRNANDSRH